MSSLRSLLAQGARLLATVSRVNSPASPAKSTERVNSEEQKVVKLKPQALTNVSSEPVSTMSPPPAKRLALSAKKVSLPAPSTLHLLVVFKPVCVFAFPCLSTSFLVDVRVLKKSFLKIWSLDVAHTGQ